MKVIFAAGGTGGHINPALASAGELRRRHPDADILFIGTKEHMESKLVPAAGFAFKTIEITGFQRKFSAKNIAKNIKKLLTYPVKRFKLILAKVCREREKK